MVVKPSEHLARPWSSPNVQAAGFPLGMFNVVTGFGKTAGGSLVRHPGVNKIVFTGGAERGKVIAQLAASHITPVLLELGGDPPTSSSTMPPCRMRTAIAGSSRRAARPVSQALGCFCMRGRPDAFVERWVERTKRITLGDPPAWPRRWGRSRLTTDQLRKVQGFVDSAISDGAERCMAGTDPTLLNCGRAGFSRPPSSMACVRSMYLAQEEGLPPGAGGC